MSDDPHFDWASHTHYMGPDEDARRLDRLRQIRRDQRADFLKFTITMVVVLGLSVGALWLAIWGTVGLLRWLGWA